MWTCFPVKVVAALLRLVTTLDFKLTYQLLDTFTEMLIKTNRAQSGT